MNFYQNLKPFSQFNQCTDDLNFVDLPPDWSIVITDIKGSTTAISEGRYKEINTIGAATIVVTRRAMKGQDFPFIFGGDGATLLIPNSHLDLVRENLSALRLLTLKNHNLDLRIGIVSAERVIQQGLPIQVGRFEMTPSLSIAVLRGEGVSWAEALVKSSNNFLDTTESDLVADLSGLSCRWNAIPSKKGEIITILVSSRKGKIVYENFFTALEVIIPGGVENANPINSDLATYKNWITILKEEIKLHHSIFSLAFCKRFVEILLSVLIFKYQLITFLIDKKRYVQSMGDHSDFRKFDDVLRMTLDCTTEQADLIEKYLKSKLEIQDLYYGTFKSNSSLMTCFVDGLGQGQHIHFVDAENGGYTTASIMLKKQMKESVNQT